MDEFAPKEYLRKQTGVTVTIKEVKMDDKKQEVVVVFSDDQGALIDGRYALAGEWAEYGKSQMNKIKQILSIESLKNQGVGKQIGVHLNLKDFVYKKGPKTGQKGTSCNIAGYFPVVDFSNDKEDTIGF